ncbi:MAG: DUF4058 family protein [Cyanobacteria bacterium P01_F01_bin.3]
MPIPFPGMNPYLEHPDLWPNVHQRFIAALADALKHQLPPAYQVRLCERRYQVSGEDSLVVGSPGLDWSRSAKALADTLSGRTISSKSVTSLAPAQVESSLLTAPACDLERRPIPVLVPVPQKIYETYLEIVDTNEEVVTVIESLSPKKKRPGRGRALYERQREMIFGSDSHFVEIDLLRGWEPSSIYGPDEAGDYRILISRSEQRPRAQLYTWNVMEPIPAIMLPLKGADDDLLLPIKPAVDQACDRTDLLVNYQQAPLPPLRRDESLWLDSFLQQVGMRPCRAS